MKLSRPILKGLNNLGFIKPTPIQARAIPLGLQGLDICGAATTGSGWILFLFFFFFFC